MAVSCGSTYYLLNKATLGIKMRWWLGTGGYSTNAGLAGSMSQHESQTVTLTAVRRSTQGESQGPRVSLTGEVGGRGKRMAKEVREFLQLRAQARHFSALSLHRDVCCPDRSYIFKCKPYFTAPPTVGSEGHVVWHSICSAHFWLQGSPQIWSLTALLWGHPKSELPPWNESSKMCLVE